MCKKLQWCQRLLFNAVQWLMKATLSFIQAAHTRSVFRHMHSFVYSLNRSDSPCTCVLAWIRSTVAKQQIAKCLSGWLESILSGALLCGVTDCMHRDVCPSLQDCPLFCTWIQVLSLCCMWDTEPQLIVCLQLTFKKAFNCTMAV